MNIFFKIAAFLSFEIRFFYGAFRLILFIMHENFKVRGAVFLKGAITGSLVSTFLIFAENLDVTYYWKTLC